MEDRFYVIDKLSDMAAQQICKSEERAKDLIARLEARDRKKGTFRNNNYFVATGEV